MQIIYKSKNKQKLKFEGEFLIGFTIFCFWVRHLAFWMSSMNFKAIFFCRCKLIRPYRLKYICSWIYISYTENVIRYMLKKLLLSVKVCMTKMEFPSSKTQKIKANHLLSERENIFPVFSLIYSSYVSDIHPKHTTNESSKS